MPQVVFKIVPLEGSLLVNGETQKRSEEILAEVAIALTLSRLRDSISKPCFVALQSFIPSFIHSFTSQQIHSFIYTLLC